MKVLVVADLHYRLRQFDWLVEAAAGVDAVVIAGDLLDIRSRVPLDVQAVAVSAALRMLGGRTLLAVASGNHDLDRRDALGEKSAGWLRAARTEQVHVDGEALLVGDDLFTICPWWDGPLGRAALDEALTGWIERHGPDLVLAGHVHQAPFVSGGAWADRIGRTWVFNAGQQPGPEPARILLDLAAGTAAWTSGEGHEQITL